MSIIKKLIEKEHFTETESIISDYILENKEKIMHLSIRDIAKNNFVGISTVARLIKKIEAEGFSTFKLKLALEVKNNEFEEFSNDNSLAFSVTNYLSKLQKKIIDQTTQFLDYEQIEQTARLIYNSTIIYAFTSSSDEQLGHELKYKMSYIGKRVEIAGNNIDNLIKCQNPSDTPLAIFFGFKNSSEELIKRVKFCNQNHIQTIIFTTNASLFTNNVCTITIIIPKFETYNEITPITHAITTWYILNIIWCCVIVLQHNSQHKK